MDHFAVIFKIMWSVLLALFDLEDEGTMILQNVFNIYQTNTAT
jgi:hypothetical protein